MVHGIHDLLSIQGGGPEVSVSIMGHVPLFAWCPVWLRDVGDGVHMWCIVGNELGPGARGAVYEQCGCSSLLFSILFLPLLGQLDI
jgi:hypothetical protein